MTRLTKPNKRDVKKSTPLPGTVNVEPEVEEEKTVHVADWSTLSYRDLQLNAKILGLKASGTKAALIKRIQGGG